MPVHYGRDSGSSAGDPSRGQKCGQLEHEVASPTHADRRDPVTGTVLLGAARILSNNIRGFSVFVIAIIV